MTTALIYDYSEWLTVVTIEFALKASSAFSHHFFKRGFNISRFLYWNLFLTMFADRLYLGW